MKIMTEKQFREAIAEERDRWYNERFVDDRFRDMANELEKLRKEVQQLRYEVELQKFEPAYSEVKK